MTRRLLLLALVTAPVTPALAADPPDPDPAAAKAEYVAAVEKSQAAFRDGYAALLKAESQTGELARVRLLRDHRRLFDAGSPLPKESPLRGLADAFRGDVRAAQTALREEYEARIKAAVMASKVADAERLEGELAWLQKLPTFGPRYLWAADGKVFQRHTATRWQEFQNGSPGGFFEEQARTARYVEIMHAGGVKVRLYRDLALIKEPHTDWHLLIEGEWQSAARRPIDPPDDE